MSAATLVSLTYITNLPYLKGLRLAHQLSSTEQFSITLLIGADQYWKIMEDYAGSTQPQATVS